MQKPANFKESACQECRKEIDLGFEIDMAFQPIVDTDSKSVFAYEALVRGANNESAGWVFQHVNDKNRYRFDQACRIKAIQQAAKLGTEQYLSINFLPNAVYQPELCIKATLAAAKDYNFPLNKLIFEFTESEQLIDHKHILKIVQYYKKLGFTVAIDDFGAGYSGLNLLADVEADIVKLDMALIRDIDKDKKRQVIVKSALRLCNQLNIRVIVEGVETQAEYLTLKEMGINLFQGYYFAKPAFRAFPELNSY
ncbi:EAL domain-containing protein [Catenovulum sp. 2E275]|uniref:EAL domain-containing protein n=1 Tax=Catenovulum sp. 2E275 TaxID=2980497 RepID=UPI0021D3BF03|nr:EAL domain-containing protein [Catenovulum sp. 2E275]MCU4674566.1 EAL domain-containing protein [Catenovulum sp. 2E275]